jgi:release factor glutamine methyltransferase
MAIDAPRVSHLLTEGRTCLRASKAIDHWRGAIAREDAEELLALALGMDVEALDPRAQVSARVERRYRGYLERRADGEPVALIRGVVEFAGLTLRVRPGVFVPRRTSELLAEAAIAAVRRRRATRVVVDVACGAAPVACAVAAALPSAEVWGLDIDPAAVRLSRANARRHDLVNAHFRVSNLLGGLPARLHGEVGALTMHPPYVARSDVRSLPREIRGFEPRHTLTDGSSDGLGLVRGLVDAAPVWLRPGGVVLVEVAPFLSRPIQALMRRADLEVTVQSDPGGITRVVAGRLPR